MAITFSNGAVIGQPGTDFSLTPTVPSGASLFAAIQAHDDGGASKSFLGATYSGNAMTEQANLDPSYPMHAAWTYDVSGLSLPDSPTIQSNVDVSDTGVLSGISISGNGVSVASVHTDGDNAASTTASTTVSCQAGDTLLIGLAWDGPAVNTDIVSDTGQSLIPNTHDNESMYAGLYSQVASGSSETVTFTNNTGLNEWSMIVLVLRETAAINTGLRDTAYDSAGALLTNETNITVVVRASQTATAVLYSTTTASTNGSGVIEIDDDAVGAVDDTVFVTMTRSNGDTLAKTMTVLNLNA